jgi:putative ABC transport system permease protein
LILLMGAVNVAGLLLARSESRAAETASRLALGADRLRLIRQHLTESLLLGILGLLGGLCLAALLQSALPSLLAREGEIPLIDVAPDARFFGCALIATLGVAFLFGFYPAWKSSRLELTTALKRSPGPRAGRLPLGRTLTGIQVALSLLLLIGAGTLVRTVLNLKSLNLGFKPERLLIFSADATLAGYKDERALAYYAHALESLAATPGVESVTFSRHGLLHASSSSSEFYYRDTNGRLQHIDDAYVHGISPNYFHTVGVPLLAGRDLIRLDDKKAKRVALVNQKMALLVRPDGASPVGLTLYQNDKGEEPIEIIGLVGDAKYDSLRDAAPATVYAPFGQRGIRGATFTLRTAAGPLSIAPVIRRVMANVDPRIPIYGLRTEEEQIGIAMERERVLARLVAGFAALALLLAAIGIYGVLTYSVARRIPEIGVRLALGAAPEKLRLMILRESLPPVAAGLAAGLVAAWWFTRLLERFVFGVKPLDIWSVVGALLLLIAGAAIAAWIPARRASLVTPMTALRYE